MSRIAHLFLLLFLATTISSNAFGGALHEAISANDIATIELLLKDGADIEETNYVIGTPLHLAISEGRSEIAALLIAHGANLEAASEQQGARPVQLAASLNEVGILRLLVEKGAEVNSRDTEGRTALHHVALFGEVESAQVLVDHAANVSLVDERSQSDPLSLATFRGKLEIVKLLVRNGADVNMKDGSGRTPLMHAATPYSVQEVGGSALIDFLIENGADIEATQDNGMTALAWAENRKLNDGYYANIVEILISHGAKN